MSKITTIESSFARLGTVVSGRLHKFVMWFERRKKKKAIDSIRATMFLCGYDVSDMTDEEIEEGVNEMAKLPAQTGVSAEQAAKGLRMVINGLEENT